MCIRLIIPSMTNRDISHMKTKCLVQIWCEYDWWEEELRTTRREWFKEHRNKIVNHENERLDRMRAGLAKKRCCNVMCRSVADGYREYRIRPNRLLCLSHYYIYSLYTAVCRAPGGTSQLRHDTWRIDRRRHGSDMGLHANRWRCYSNTMVLQQSRSGLKPFYNIQLINIVFVRNELAFDAGE